MLVLTREIGEKIVINDNITITIIDIRNCCKVRVGVEAPQSVSIHREEIYDEIKRKGGRLERKVTRSSHPQIRSNSLENHDGSQD